MDPTNGADHEDPDTESRKIGPEAGLAHDSGKRGRPTAAASQSSLPESAIRVSGAGGETYVLISGLMGGVAGFRRLEALLVEQGHRVIIIDPYRLSEDSADLSFTALARRVDRVLDKNRVPFARVVGHSHGGGVALRFAALNPNR